MRRSEREITDRAQLTHILDSCKVLRLAMVDDGKPYVLPMNFGYEWSGELPTLVLHSAPEGRKLDILRKHPEICFELDCDHELVEAPVDAACGYGFRFSSIIGEGTVAELVDIAEKRAAIDLLMACQTGGKTGFSYDDAVLARTAVLRIAVSALSGKARA